MYEKYMSGQESPYLADTFAVSICIFPAQWKAAPVLNLRWPGCAYFIYVVVFFLSPLRGGVGVLHYFSSPCLAGVLFNLLLL